MSGDVQKKSNSTLVALNTVSQLMAKTITSGVTFFISILLARTYGATGYGDFTKITTYLALFYLFTDFGLNALYLQHQNDSQTSKTAFITLQSVRFFLTVGSMFIALAILAFLPGNTVGGYSSIVKLGIILYSPTILFQSIITTTNALFQKHLRYDVASLSSMIGSFITLIFVFISTKLFLPDAALMAIIISMMIGMASTAIISILFVRQIQPIHLQLSLQVSKNFFLQALPLGLTLICNVIYFRADNFILTLTRPTADVGIYGFAYKLFEFILVIPTFFMNAVYPLMVKSVGNASGLQPEFSRLWKKSAGFLFFSSVVIGSVLWICAPYIALVKQEFVGSVHAFRILLISTPFFFLSSLTMWIMVALKKYWMLITVYATSMCLNIFLNVIFIPSYGYIAAAWITLCSEAFVFLFSCLFLMRVFHKE